MVKEGDVFEGDEIEIAETFTKEMELRVKEYGKTVAVIGPASKISFSRVNMTDLVGDITPWGTTFQTIYTGQRIVVKVVTIYPKGLIRLPEYVLEIDVVRK